MNISLSDSLKSFVDEQVAGRGYGTSSEFVRELIRADQDLDIAIRERSGEWGGFHQGQRAIVMEAAARIRRSAWHLHWPIGWSCGTSGS